MELLERGDFLSKLGNTFNNLSGGNGAVVMVSGEAGIGKTSLVENFTKKVQDKTKVLWGACDALFAPRPLGPLYDMASQLNNGVLNFLNDQTARPEIFPGLLKHLQACPTPNVLVVEDVHWADESTLDLIKFLGRRANRLNSLMIITYRDDEITATHPLRLVLGDIPSKDLIRFKLPPLTKQTVESLADSSGIKNLFELTLGNPFLINEIISSKEEGIPSTIKDSIVTRISRLSPDARELVELVSIIPTRTERWLIDSLLPDNQKILDECFNSGVLLPEGAAVSFKHELSRMAAEASLSESKRLQLNKKVLSTLLEQEKTDDYLARIIHHAAASHNEEMIIKYAPDAARQASKLGAHLLAANHYKNALKFADNLPPEKQLEFYEGRSYECYLTGEVEEGINAGEKVIELLEKFPDPEREGENYRRMSRILWYDCKDRKAEEYLDKAIDIFEKLKPGRKLAMAYSNKSQTYMIREDNETAIRWGEKALELARRLNEPEIEAHALNNVGTSKLILGDDTGREDLKRSLEISLRNDFYEHATRAYINLGSIEMLRRNLAEADRYFTAGSEYSNEKDLYIFSLCLAGHHSKVKLHLGKWDEAVDMTSDIFKKEIVPPGNKVMPIAVTGLIRARRNDPRSMPLIEESLKLALRMGENEKITTAVAAKAEAYWLQNKLPDIFDELESIYNMVKKTNNVWAIGEIAFWLWKAGGLSEIPQGIAEPFLLQIKGDWKSAAEKWETKQCPYEEALALSDGDNDAKIKAIEIFNSLGATAAVQLIKQKMRESGIRGIPKGPRKTTRENLAGLTNRQIEVLHLVSKGLSNNEIGNRLYISAKTVDHHISTILSKLNIHSRYEAAAYLQSNSMLEK